MNASRLRQSFFPREYNLFRPAYWFGDIDARPVSLFRMAFAALMLKEALYHLPMAQLFFSDSGIVPRDALAQIPLGGRFSLMSGLPETWTVSVVFIIWALVALGLLLGWRTRWMTLLNFLLLLSVINRNPLVTTGADMVMIALAFWSLFIPLGRFYSLDARRHSQPATVYAFPVRMFQLQVAIIYGFTTVIKLQGQDWPHGDALYRALQISMYTFPTGDWLLMNAPIALLRALTGFTLLVEGGFGLLVFAPVLQPYLRALGLLLGVVLHIGIGVMMAIANFPLVMLSSYLVFLDSRWVDWLEERAGRIMSRNRIEETSPARNPPVQPDLPRGCAGLLAAMARASVQGAYRAALAGLLVCCMACVLWGNITDNDKLALDFNVPPLPPTLDSLMKSLEMAQSWGLFAPEPVREDGWLILAGQFTDGHTIDLRTGVPPGDVRPRWWIGPWARWPKFEENIMHTSGYNPIFAAWGDYACSQTSNLVSLAITLRSRSTAAPGQPFQPYHDQILWQGTCRISGAAA
jgi:HTTM domain